MCTRSTMMEKPLFRHVESEIITHYDAKIVICANGYMKARRYKKSLQKREAGFEYSDILETPKEEFEDSDVPDIKKILKAGRIAHTDKPCEARIIRRDSLNRTRDTLIGYACENEADWHSFITLTFAENMTDVSEANKHFANWCRQIKRKKPDFRFLCVPEFQKRGAVHYHLLSNLKCGEDIPALEPITTYNKEKRKYYTLYYYNLPHWSYGFSTAEDLSTFDDNFNCALYITKYLFKDVDNRLWGRNKILKSNNLNKPSEYLTQNETFGRAMNYIKKMRYEVCTYDFEPVEHYQIPQTIYTVKITSQDDCNTVKDILATGAEAGRVGSR